MSTPEDYGEGAGANEVLGIVLVVADDLHLSRVSDLYRRAEVDGLSTTRGCIARDRRSICGVAVVVLCKNDSTLSGFDQRWRNAQPQNPYTSSIITVLDCDIELSLLILRSNAPQEAGEEPRTRQRGRGRRWKRGIEGARRMRPRKHKTHHGEDAPRTPALRATRHALSSALTRPSMTVKRWRNVRHRREARSRARDVVTEEIWNTRYACRWHFVTPTSSFVERADWLRSVWEDRRTNPAHVQ